MTDTVIYHNPRCSKSRATLALLEENQIDHTTRSYLETPPDATEIRSLIAAGLSISELIRTGEDEFAATGLDINTSSEEELITAITQHPKILQRPIVVHKGAARIGRPPEQVMALFSL